VGPRGGISSLMKTKIAACAGRPQTVTVLVELSFSELNCVRVYIVCGLRYNVLSSHILCLAVIIHVFIRESQ
jgi:hypothetical protein